MLEEYWGKADPKCPGAPKWHPLAYHSLDVAAVAASWWDSNPALRAKFGLAFACATEEMLRLRAWVLFFVALHDLGKFDLRFQLKAPDALAAAWRRLDKGRDHAIPSTDIHGFDHGHAGIAWAKLELASWLGKGGDEIAWPHWERWLAAVTGHHGDYCLPGMEGLEGIEADDALVEHDRDARQAFVTALAGLFLEPAGLRVQDLPPACSMPARALLAGFCASCDWLGSNAEVFGYRAP
ncbi:MAG TPA: CRISPR-associated endonuclease Cas3'', partial [Pseudomonadota bacterium]|nr:CRISPR-associated endonuclease Cas3'' [Pseudomonadota bacterium]